MRGRRLALWFFLSVCLLGIPWLGQEARAEEARSTLLTRSGYADTFSVLRPEVRAREREAQGRYTYCIRSSAVYECLSYSSDGAVRRQRHRADGHGTGFAYRAEGQDTLILTNQHVSEWPAVTDAAHAVEEVPAGCKRISESLSIVDNDDDDYGADDIPLQRVVTDEALDVAVLRAHAPLKVLPYHLGRSAALTAGDVVLIRGFPLAAFQAMNTGKVINTYDHDQFHEWDHVDFIIDAPLSSGNSGSPVLAVNRRTGDYELVGVFHAHYIHGAALDAVVGIDQLVPLMTTLRRAVRDPEKPGRLGPPQRADLLQALAQPGYLPYLSLGPLTVGLRRLATSAGDTLVYEVFTARFPLDDHRALLLVDGPGPAAGLPPRLWFGGEQGLRSSAPRLLEPEAREQMQSVQQRLRALALSTLRYRRLSEHAAQSRDGADERAALQRQLRREAAGDNELAQAVLDVAERLAPRSASESQTLPAALAELSANASDDRLLAADTGAQGR